MSTASPLQVCTSVAQHNELLTGNQSPGRLLVLVFLASWHPPCRQMKQVAQTLAQQFDKDTFAEVDAEAVPDVTELYPVESVPTSVLIKGGKVVATLAGANAVELTNLVTKHSRTSATVDAASASTSTGAASSPAESKADLDARLSKLVRAAPVMAFIKGTPDAPRCGFTKQMIALLNDKNIEYGHFDILSDNSVREGLKVFSNWPTYPQLYVNGELMGGLDVVKEMAESGDLDAAIPPAHIKKAQGGSGCCGGKSGGGCCGGGGARAGGGCCKGKAHNTEAPAAPALEDRLRSLIASHRIMLFMKGSPSAPRCGFSKKAVELLRSQGLDVDSSSDFGSFDIFSDNDVREGLKKLSNWPTYPQLYIDGELVGGLDVMQEMAESGELKSMLTPDTQQ